MNKIKIINFSKGPTEFDVDLYNAVKKEELTLSVIPRLRYSSESDYMGFQLDVALMADNKRVLKTGFLFGLLVDGWSEMLKAGVNLTIERDRLVEICSIVWLASTGVIALQTNSNKKSGYILPPVDVNKLTEELILQTGN